MSIEYMRVEPKELAVGESFTLTAGIINDRGDSYDFELKVRSVVRVKGKIPRRTSVKTTIRPPVRSRLSPNAKYEYQCSLMHLKDEVELDVFVDWLEIPTHKVKGIDIGVVFIKTKKEKTPIDKFRNFIDYLLPMPASIGPPLPKVLEVTWVPEYPRR